MSTSENNFLVQPEYVIDRQADYDQQKAILKKWSHVAKDDTGSGNIGMDIFYNATEKHVAMVDSDALYNKYKGKHYGMPEYTPLYHAISPALMLYRCIATFSKAPNCNTDHYKYIWSYSLKHKSSGQFFTITEHKGAVSIHSNFGGFKTVPTEIREDLEQLLTYLLSDVCAHPYDGLVAGSVA